MLRFVKKVAERGREAERRKRVAEEGGRGGEKYVFSGFPWS